MILLAMLGIAAYFILPLMLVMWLLERNDYKIFRWDADVQLVGWGTVLVELAFAAQILYWVL